MWNVNDKVQHVRLGRGTVVGVVAGGCVDVVFDVDCYADSADTRRIRAEDLQEYDEQSTLKTGADMTPDEVARLVDRILTSEARVERIKEQCQSWITRAKSEHASLERWLRPVIADYMAAHPPAKGKTLHTPAGSVSLRTVPAHVSIEDEGETLRWARENHEKAIVVRESISAAEIKAWVGAFGEIPPGCVMVDDEERMYVRALKKGESE